MDAEAKGYVTVADLERIMGSRAHAEEVMGDLREALGDNGRLTFDVLKQQLAKAGHRAEFVDGALVVNTSVRVRKDGVHGRFLIEGAYGEDYLRVRELLYGQVEAL